MIFSEKMFAISVFAFVFTVVLVFAALHFFPKWKLLDRPEKYGLTRGPIPYSGGLVMYLVFLLAILFFVPLDRGMMGVLIGLSLLVITSFLDDRYFLNPFLRLFVQFLAAGIVVYGGVGIRSLTNPFGAPVVLDQIQFSFFGEPVFLLSAIFTIVWIMFMANSMNFLDGVPGLVSGVSFLACLTIFLLSIRPGHVVDQTPVALMSGILSALSLGFLLFDFPPPRILMGDTGSVMLGFLIAVLAIFSGGKIATAFLVMGFPLLDAAFTIVRRIAKGQPPWRGDFGHLHHRLLQAGFSQRQVVIIVCLISALFGGTALFLGSEQKFFALIFLALIMISLLTWLFFLGKKNSS